MGADLYIMKLNHDAQITGFRTDVGVGYFRDSYNDWNVLWKFGLSYWVDFKTLVNKDYQMSPRNAKKLLGLLKSKEPKFQKAIANENKSDKTWFGKHYQELQVFLNKAIELKSYIDCSV